MLTRKTIDKSSNWVKRVRLGVARMASPRLQHRELSVLVGVLAGILLSVFATETSVTSFGLIDLIIFLTIPSLSGALVGFGDPEHSAANGALVGIVAGLGYVAMAAVRLTSLVPANIALFLILAVPFWGFLGSAGSMFAHKAISATPSPAPAVKVCSSCKTSNPPDAAFCKNCGNKL